MSGVGYLIKLTNKSEYMSNRITQVDADRVSRKLTEGKLLKHQAAKKAFEQAVYEAYIQQTPDLIHDAHKKHPEYFNESTGVYMDGHGFHRDVVNVGWYEEDGDKKIVVSNSGTDRPQLYLNKELAANLILLKRKYEKLKAEYDGAKSSIKNALLNLRTYAKISEKFPEAIEFLPEKQTMAVAINYQHVRNLIELPSETDKKTVS